MKIPINKIKENIEEKLINFLLKNKGYAMNTEYISEKIKEPYPKVYNRLKKLVKNNKIKESKVEKSFVFYIE